jgi:anaerobic magnesium-protoporphyrin IX monomethyl ester cyclase
MRAVFYYPFRHFYDPHGVYALSAALVRTGAEVRCVRETRHDRAVAAVLRLEPDVVLYSSFARSIPFFNDFDRLLKAAAPRVRSLIGGPGPTFDPDPLAGSTIDAACVVEGDLALPDFLAEDRWSGPNFRARGGPSPAGFCRLADLDGLPMPDREPLYREDAVLRESPSKQFLSGRGCPYRCTYCFNHKFNEMFRGLGPVVRKKSVDYLLEEIRRVRARWPLQTVCFNDDTFILGREWLLEFCGRFPREIGLPYTCNVRANLVCDEVAEALARSGCTGVAWSIETADPALRDDVLKRGMTTEQIRTTARALRKHGIGFRIGSLVGLPGETPDQMLRTLELNIEAAPELATASIFTPFPGLELTEYAVRTGRYAPRGNRDLPWDYATRSVLDYTEKENDDMVRLVRLFPLFVRFPALYRNAAVRSLLLRLPIPLLRPLFDAPYLLGMMRLHVGRANMAQRLRMAWRYLEGLLEH